MKKFQAGCKVQNDPKKRETKNIYTERQKKAENQLRLKKLKNRYKTPTISNEREN